MPVYVYRCDNNKCEHEFEIFQHMSEKPKVQCPQCKKRKLYKVPQAIYGFVRGSDRETVGTYAEKNTKRLGADRILEDKMKEEEADEKRRRNTPPPPGMERVQKSKKKPWWRKHKPKIDKKVVSMTPEQKMKYIKDGTT